MAGARCLSSLGAVAPLSRTLLPLKSTSKWFKCRLLVTRIERCISAYSSHQTPQHCQLRRIHCSPPLAVPLRPPSVANGALAARLEQLRAHSISISPIACTRYSTYKETTVPAAAPVRQSSLVTAESEHSDVQAPAGQQSQSVAVNFVSDGVRTMAEPGENLWAVAQKCGVTIPLSCGRGDCGTCEMEVRKWDLDNVEGGTAVVRTCIAAVPPGYARLELDAMEDHIWGADGFDM
mmetsp:Transcript_10121/g.30300  ORF Transcript_10121/g.30300 Transcript_10121/m.30300 type:complete len:235 (-) Transcript_10121:299-1003(-)